jgi:heterodisulfide reductase subunit B
MKVTNYEIQTNPKIKKAISNSLGEDYDGSVNVHHFVEVLVKDIGIKKLQETFTHSLDGLKVVNYYGCLLVRPQEATNFDDPENPTIMDSLVTIMGGESIDWPHKVECCGGGFALTRTDIVIELSNSILGMAKAAGAECMAVACPMCQVNLDLRQSDINKVKHSSHNIPIVYITQLVGLCLGIAPEKLGMDKCVVSPRPIIEAIKSNY